MSPVEKSIEAQVIIDVEPELIVTIRDDPLTSVFLYDTLVVASIDLLEEPHKIYVDLDNLTDEESDPSGQGIRIIMPIVFSKSVGGRKTTFGRTSLTINNTRAVSGINIGTAMPYPLGDDE